MHDAEQARLAAQVRWGNAQLAEKATREGNDGAGIDAAKAEQLAAMDEIGRIDEEIRTGAREEKVVLIAPNPNANFEDSIGGVAVKWVAGRAEVPRSLAEKMVLDFEDYSIEGEDA